MSRSWTVALRRTLAALLVMATMAACGGEPPESKDPPRSDVESLSSTVLARTAAILSALVTRTGADDPRYLSDATWFDSSPSCLRCSLGPALLAAVQARLTGEQRFATVAVESLSRAVRRDQGQDGAFGRPDPDQGSSEIETVFLANTLAASYLVLGDRLPETDRALWKASLIRAADFLIANGNLRFYVNGNINLAVIENMDLVARITGEPRFAAARRTATEFALDTAGTRPGLRYTREPQRSDGSDGRGYLTESGGGAQGFDPFYTTMQLSIAAQWFAVTGNPTAKRLTNLLYNQLRPRIRMSDWTIDLAGGTRDLAHGDRYYFTSPAPTVLALHGGRADLRREVPGSLRVSVRTFQRATSQVNPGLSYGYGLDLAPALLVLGRDTG